MDQAAAQTPRSTCGGLVVSRPPYFGLADWNIDNLVYQCVFRAHPLTECLGIDKWLEGGAGLAAGLFYVIKAILFEISTADPGLDLPTGRIKRQETGLDLHFLLP